MNGPPASGQRLEAHDEVVRRILDARVIAISRAASGDVALTQALAVLAGGLAIVEVSLTTPDALDAVRELAAVDDDRVVGTGTVRTAEQARAAIGAGARFLVSPILVPEVIAVATPLGVPVIPGAMTPNEIVAARASGAELVKLFPASTVGPEHLRAVRTVLPDIVLVPTGGVAVEDVPGWLAAGAGAVGVSSALTDGPADVVTARTRQLLRSVRCS